MDMQAFLKRFLLHKKWKVQNWIIKGDRKISPIQLDIARMTYQLGNNG